MRVKIHRNLNAPGGAVEWSVTATLGSNRGRVIGYVSAAVLQEVVFKTRPSAIERVQQRRARAREVCAWVEGELVQGDVTRFRLNRDLNARPVETSPGHSCKRIRIDVLNGRTDFFEEGTGVSISRAKRVMLTDSGQCWSDTFEEE